jgi:hypothetical protein
MQKIHMLSEQPIQSRRIREPELVEVQLFPIPPPLPKIEEAREVIEVDSGMAISHPETVMARGVSERVKGLPEPLPLPEPMGPLRREDVEKAVRLIKDDRPKELIKPFPADIPPGTPVEMFKRDVIVEKLREPEGPLPLPRPPFGQRIPEISGRGVKEELPRHEEVEKLVEVNNRENLDEVLKRVEEQRRREAEPGERLDQLKPMQRWAVPRLIEILAPPETAPEPLPRPRQGIHRSIELPEPPFTIPLWRRMWPKPIELFSAERRREVLA